jgi:hypothetical protein
MLASCRANQWRGRRHKRAQVGARSSSRPRRRPGTEWSSDRGVQVLIAACRIWRRHGCRGWSRRRGGGGRHVGMGSSLLTSRWSRSPGRAGSERRSADLSWRVDDHRQLPAGLPGGTPAGSVAVAHCAEGHRNAVFVSTDDTTTRVLHSVCTCRSRSRGLVTSQSVQLASHPKVWRILIEKVTNQYRRRKSCRDSHVYWCWGPCWGR